MRTQHFLLLSSIALSGAAVAVEPKPGTNAPGKPGAEAVSGTGKATKAASGQEKEPVRPARKNRVRQTFPPASKN